MRLHYTFNGSYVTTPYGKSRCPSDESLAAFIDGRYNEINLSSINDHLNFCPRCYAIVHETRGTLREMKEIDKGQNNA